MHAGNLCKSLQCVTIFEIVLALQAAAAEPVTRNGHDNVVSAIVFSPDGTRLVSGSWDETVRVWSLEDVGRSVVLNGHTDWVEAVVVSPDCQHIISASQRSVRTWNATTGDLESVWTAPGAFSISALALSPDGRWLGCGVRDGTVRVWEVGADESRWTLQTDSAWTKSLTFSSDAGRLAAGNWLGQLRVWDLSAGGQSVHSHDAHTGAPMALAFSPDGARLATGSYDATIKVWDTGSWQLKQTLARHKGLVLSLAFSPDSLLLASGERHGLVKVWSEGPEPLLEFAGHPDGKLGFSVVSLAFAPDGQTLASASYDKTIKLWRLDRP